MFSVGLLVAVVSCLVIAYSFWVYVNVVPPKDITERINVLEEQQIAEMDLMQSLAAFEQLQTSGLPEEVPPLWVQAQQIAQQKRTLMIWTGASAIAGTLAVILALLIRPAK